MTRGVMVSPTAILGHFRIIQMDEWDQDFVDEEVEGTSDSIQTALARSNSVTSTVR
jgi:hypothetical protein